MAMAEVNLMVNKKEIFKKACSLAMKAHNSPEKPYIAEKIRSLDIIFTFPGSWSANDWYSHAPFGDIGIDLSLFPSIRSIGNNEVAKVNQAFLRRFIGILTNSAFQTEVEKAAGQKKQIVFAGHSSGGPIAILATVWLLEKYRKSNNNQSMLPLCLTFGSPLIADRIFNHALQRENWSRCFIHFVMRFDIVPHLLLAPSSSIAQELQSYLHFFNPKSSFAQQPAARSMEAFFMNVMRNVSSVASHAACILMGSTNLLLESVLSFIELSPYRPSGTYIFCTGNGKLVTVKNADAVLQLLFYSSQLRSEAEAADVSCKSLKEHLVYENELQESLEMLSVVCLDNLAELPLSPDCAEGDNASINIAMNDLGVSTRGRLCLRAAGELEKHKERNQASIIDKKGKIEECINALRSYQNKSDVDKVGYYDAFKLQKTEVDFRANVKRLELAGIWDQIIEMLRRYQLPEGFECKKEWVELGTRYRRIAEPLDIANYYRLLLNDNTGPYMKDGRPKRYRYTQRWREHAEVLPATSSWESCFWAEVEELSIQTSNNVPFEDIKDKICSLEREADKWVCNGMLGKDVFSEKSTFVKWWKTLPNQHKSGSCIDRHING